MSTSVITDPGVPALEILLGEGSGPLIGAFLDQTGEGLRSHRVAQVRYVPGRSVTVQFQAETTSRQGETAWSSFVASAGVDLPDGVAVMGAGDLEIAMWRFPDDPLLPGLAPATDPQRVGEILAQLGASEGKLTLRTRSYRPTRRAVIEVIGEKHRLFIKVVRPSQAHELQTIHRRLAPHIPAPTSLGWNDDLGIVAMQALPGRTLRKAVTIRSGSLPSGQQINALLEMLPATSDHDRRVPGPHERALEHATLLSAIDPPSSAQLDSIVDALALTEPEPTVAVHGDFHSSQVMVHNRDIVGVVDVDTAGAGERSSDLAGLLGHLSTLSLDSPARSHIERYGSTLMRDFDQIVEPTGLRQRVAGVILGLATGPFRVQERRWVEATRARIGLAARWLESASRLDA